MKTAVEEAEAKKQRDKEEALAQLRKEMQALVDQANAERDEHLANYTKVMSLARRVLISFI